MLLRTQLPSRTPRAWTSRLLTVPQPKQMPPITALQARPHNTCKNGKTLLIFPEGTREKEGKLLPPKSGLFVIAAGAGVDVVPCRILYDTPDGKMHLFCRVRVIYGEPMPAAQFAMEGRRDTKKLRANKQALLDAWEKMGA